MGSIYLDKAEQTVLYQRYLLYANRLACSFGCPSLDATSCEFLAVEGLEKALMAFRRDKKTVFSTFLYHCVRSRVVNELRSMNRRNRVLVSIQEENLAHIPYKSYERSIFDDFDISRVRSALSYCQLRNLFDFIVYKTYMGTYRELSRAYGLSLSTFYIRLLKIRKIISEVLKNG